MLHVEAVGEIKNKEVALKIIHLALNILSIEVRSVQFSI